MGLPFATRAPTCEEVNLLRLMLSTFKDGSGNETESDGTTRAGWREIERCIADWLNGLGGENKAIFDVIAPDSLNPSVCYGYSVKSKQLSNSMFDKLPIGARVYMEIANSPAKFWAEIKRLHGLEEADFRNQKHPSEIGDSVLSLVMKWHQEGKALFESHNKNTTLDLEHSCYLCVSYSKDTPSNRRYQIHSFGLQYPKDITWKYTSDSCLSAYDTLGEKLIDWYGVSGGQLKYYPKANAAIFSTNVFKLLPPPKQLSIKDKARIHFPEHFKD